MFIDILALLCKLYFKKIKLEDRKSYFRVFQNTTPLTSLPELEQDKMCLVQGRLLLLTDLYKGR